VINNKGVNAMLKAQVDKLIVHFNSGLFNHTVITGTEIELECFQAALKNKFKIIKQSVYELELTTSALILNKKEDGDLLFVSGLQNLPAQHSNTYAIRTHLDKGVYTQIRSFIFCEAESYEKHFKDYNAPFYKFCLQYPLGE
jgi:hypothetical protein